MTLSELKYIVAVARERHFGRAAERCFVSQPTLSVAVKKLERELGVTLFERGQGEVTVTPLGERVVGQAQTILEQVETLRALAQSGSDPLAGPLRVGAIYTIGPYLFPELVPRLAGTVPQMPLHIEENFTAALAEQLHHGEQDAIIISLPFDEPGIETLPLYREPFHVLLPSAHPWAGEPEIDSRRLADEQVLLLGQGHCFRDQVLAVCPECLRPAAAGHDDPQNYEGSSLETIRYMVASGLGITVLPHAAARADRLPPGLLVTRPFAGAAPERTVALAWRRSFPRPQAVAALARGILASLGDGLTPLADEAQLG